MSSDPPQAAQPLDPTPRAEPLVPLLTVEQALGDPDALATWHSALSNAIATEVPHDLLGLWLYPALGGSVLLGPEALAQDELMVPLPSPQVQPSQLAVLEDIVRDAGYPSVMALPIRSGRRDAGLILLADLRPARYDETDRMVLELVGQRLAPVFSRMAQQWSLATGAPAQAARVAALLEAIAFAGTHLASPQLFVAELGRAIEPLLPHDLLDVLVANGTEARLYRLGQHAGGPLWADPSLVLERGVLDLAGMLAGESTLVIGDTYHEEGWPRGYLTVEEPAGAELRSVVAARVRGPQGLSAFLVAGSVGAGLYRDDDAALLGRVAGLIAAQVAVLVAAGSPAPATQTVAGAEQPSLLDAAELLATGTEFAATTRRVADLAARLLPFDELRFAIRLSEGDRVVLLEPGERRPLPDLPLVPVGGTTLAAVLQGEVPSSFMLVNGEARLIVPLRVAGRVHGALVLTAKPPAILREVHLRAAQQLADVVACHLELLRRTALLPPPYLPGWKKVR
jgi:hypothetical protein